MSIILSPTDRKSLMDAGFPRQTLNKWINQGVEPRPGNRNLVKRIIGRDPWAKKKKNSKSA